MTGGRVRRVHFVWRKEVWIIWEQQGQEYVTSVVTHMVFDFFLGGSGGGLKFGMRIKILDPDGS